MKEIMKDIEEERSPGRSAFFFFDGSAKEPLAKSPEGLYRSLVYQLIPKFKPELHRLLTSYHEKMCRPWYVDELQDVLESMFSQEQETPSTIIIDALDECNQDPVLVFEFLQHLLKTSSVFGARLNIAISSRSSFNPEYVSCNAVSIEDYNKADIAIYVKEKFRTRRQRDAEAVFEPSWRAFESALVEQASGVFLWVVLVVNSLLEDRRKGRSFDQLEKVLKRIPNDIEILLGRLLAEYKADEVESAIHFFQWVLLSGRPLSLHEWNHILAMIEMPHIGSIGDWDDTKYCEQDDFEYAAAKSKLLEDRIRALSKGLVEIRDRQSSTPGDTSVVGASSIRASAGSFSNGVVVEFIHGAIYKFFMSGAGFRKLSSPLDVDPITSGHLYILRCCIRYSLLEEMDDLRINISGYEMERRMTLRTKGSYLLDRISTCKQHRGRAQFTRDKRNEVDALKKDILLFLTEFKNKEELKYLLSSPVAFPLLSFAQCYSNRRQVSDVLDDSKSTSSDSETGDLARQLSKSTENKGHKGAKHGMHEDYRSQSSNQRSHSPSNSSVGSFESASSRSGRRTIYLDGTKSPWGEALSKISSKIVHEYSINRFLKETESAEEHVEDAGLQSHTLFDSSTWEPPPFKDDLPHLYQYICNYSIFHAQCCDCGLSKGDADKLIREDLASSNFEKWLWFLDGVDSWTDMYTLATEFDLASWVDSLMRFGEDRPRISIKKKPPVILAAECGSHRVLAHLLQKRESNILVTDREDWTVFHHAAASSSTILLSTIWENSKNYPSAINERDRDGRTPLHIASLRSSAVVVENLIDHGAAIAGVDSRGNTTLHLACMREPLNIEVIVVLLKNGAVLDWPKPSDWSREMSVPPPAFIISAWFDKCVHTPLDSLREKYQDSEVILDSIVDIMFPDAIADGLHPAGLPKNSLSKVTYLTSYYFHQVMRRSR